MSFKISIKALMSKKSAYYTRPTLANTTASGTFPDQGFCGTSQDEFAAAAEAFYDHNVLELMKGIREGSILAQLSDVTLKSLDDIAPSVEVEAIEPMPTTFLTAAGRSMRLSDLSVLKLLGVGGSGKVYLTKDTISTQCFALKVIKKSGRVPQSLENILREQRVLRKVSCQDGFLSLEASWHDTENFYLATPYFAGGDLACELIRCRKFEAERAKLYTAELIHALDFLHQAKIIHRDVKPSNILVRADGHIILADFGLSRVFSDVADDALTSKPSWVSFESDEELRASDSEHGEFMTKEVTGTAYFMAPEMHYGQSYSFNVDFWAVGVTLYRMLTGRMPFGATAVTKYEIPTSIAKDSLLFTSEDNVDPITQDFLQGVLAKNSEHRLTVEEIKKHGYFLGIDWAQLASREVDAQWKPFLKHIPNTGHTDIPINPGHNYASTDDPFPSYTFNSTYIQFGTEMANPGKDVEVKAIKDTSRPVLDKVYAFFRIVLTLGGEKAPSPAPPRPTISSPMPFVAQSPKRTTSTMQSAVTAVTSSIASTLQEKPASSSLLTLPRPNESRLDRLTGWMRRICRTDPKTHKGLKPLLLRTDLF